MLNIELSNIRLKKGMFKNSLIPYFRLNKPIGAFSNG